MLFAVLKVFGLAVGNLLGSLSALAKQERMLVINDISGTRGVFHALTPAEHHDNVICVEKYFMQGTI